MNGGGAVSMVVPAPPKSDPHPADEEKPSSIKRIELPRIDYEEDVEVEPTKLGPTGSSSGISQALPILYDQDAEDEPTQASPLIVTSAAAQTDTGLRRKRNEDSLFVSDEHAVYVVADGMGGYSGGELASSIAVQQIGDALKGDTMNHVKSPDPKLPRRAAELAIAIQRANLAIHARASEDKRLEGMGTTVTAARFSQNKQRLYIGHVGDSRAYRFRDGMLTQITADHTMRDLGVTGPEAAHLSRAVGIWPAVPIDVLIAKPLPGDKYLLCSDGLTKMVPCEEILQILTEERKPERLVARLVARANERGGKDNVTVIIVCVHPATYDRKVA